MSQLTQQTQNVTATQTTEHVLPNQTTTSLIVSHYFEKQHKNVLQDIDTLIKDAQSLEDAGFQSNAYFIEGTYNVPGPNGAQRQERMFSITEAGFALLAMGFTGTKALAWKLKFLNRFMEMAKHIQQQQAAKATEYLRLATLYSQQKSATPVEKMRKVIEAEDLRKHEHARLVRVYEHMLDRMLVEYETSETLYALCKNLPELKQRKAANVIVLWRNMFAERMRFDRLYDRTYSPNERHDTLRERHMAKFDDLIPEEILRNPMIVSNISDDFDKTNTRSDVESD